MELEKIRAMLSLATEYNLSELSLKEGDDKLSFRRNDSSSNTPQNENQNRTSSPVPTQEAQMIGDNILPSPLIGTCYLTIPASSAPIIVLGQYVEAGDTLCVIEAMQVMNEIVAHKSGTVSAILIRNGTMVEFDQPLMVIE